MIRAARRAAAGVSIQPVWKNCDTVFRPTRDSPEVQGHPRRKGREGKAFFVFSGPRRWGEERERPTDRHTTGLLPSLRRSSAARLFFPHLCATSSRGMLLGDERIERSLRFCVIQSFLFWDGWIQNYSLHPVILNYFSFSGFCFFLLLRNWIFRNWIGFLDWTEFFFKETEVEDCCNENNWQ